MAKRKKEKLSREQLTKLRDKYKKPQELNHAIACISERIAKDIVQALKKEES